MGFRYFAVFRNLHRVLRYTLPIFLIVVSTASHVVAQRGGGAGPKPQVDPQVQAVLDKMATEGVLKPTTLVGGQAHVSLLYNSGRTS
jgi:hypothetical protein